MLFGNDFSTKMRMRWHEEVRERGQENWFEPALDPRRKEQRGCRRCGTCIFWKTYSNYKFVGACRQGNWLQRLFRGPRPDTHWCKRWVPDMSKL